MKTNLGKDSITVGCSYMEDDTDVDRTDGVTYYVVDVSGDHPTDMGHQDVEDSIGRNPTYVGS